ncbi:rod shape-determining protein MreC [Candidatus Steffania adelgidicola]|uniref:rod shape-determining protein MreC n=1 Tax=Candidatus Steffania adelgidicola TaxID=1076626 RepID=UPI001D003768|nr:rod shape-determining protein MreC [Candidatus Steffania adelgidicola]UDG80042.1 Cell shape-determining protein MreC [Candidatus Steffania adelgidicola]
MRIQFGRGSALQLRLLLAVIVAIAAIIGDSKLGIFLKIRTDLNMVVSPFYFLAHAPSQILDNISRILASHTELMLENRLLRKSLLLKNSEQLLLGEYKQENNLLRKLLGAPLRQDEEKIFTQVIAISTDPYREQVLIDKGLDNGVYIGQPVISDTGVVGQVIGTSKLNSQVLLICDAAHALPIQVLRNNIRVIVSGNGCINDLQLEHVPSNTDIRIGDVLVTSGLGGRFPEGYPVAVVSSIKIDTHRAYSVIQAHPAAYLQRLHYLLLLRVPNRGRKIPLSFEEVRKVADERLIKMILPLPQDMPQPVILDVPPACGFKCSLAARGYNIQDTPAASDQEIGNARIQRWLLSYGVAGE